MMGYPFSCLTYPAFIVFVNCLIRCVCTLFSAPCVPKISTSQANQAILDVSCEIFVPRTCGWLLPSVCGWILQDWGWILDYAAASQLFVQMGCAAAAHKIHCPARNQRIGHYFLRKGVSFQFHCSDVSQELNRHVAISSLGWNFLTHWHTKHFPITLNK